MIHHVTVTVFDLYTVFQFWGLLPDLCKLRKVEIEAYETEKIGRKKNVTDEF